jgi:tetratricopeptide (TPR) repeat protein
MAKRVVPLKPSGNSKGGTRIYQLPDLTSRGYLFLTNFWLQALIIVVVSVVFYWNSRSNQYALDDDIVMRQNAYVQKGFAGVPEILGNDAYKSFYQSMGVKQQLEGGRYRPLSIVTFAIEQQLLDSCLGARFEEVRDSVFNIQQTSGISDIGGQARLIGEKNFLEQAIKRANLRIADERHIMQILWYALSLVIILAFLRRHIFRENADIAFLTVLLFAIHPIHTEVVANVKSRDEIFSLMFIVLTLDYFFRYDLSKKTSDLVWGCVYFFLAFLSKEYAAVLVVLIPAGLMILHKRKLSELNHIWLPIGGVLFVYALVRMGVRDPDDRTAQQIIADKIQQEKTKDPLNDPYMYAKGPQEFLSKVNRLDDYVWLLIAPVILAADYSYQHFPYSGLGDPGVYLSLLVMGVMLWGTWKLWQKRHPLAFAMLFFFGFFMLINNIFFDIGATMGERLIYHSSLGFCMMLAWGIVWLAERLQEHKRKIIVTATIIALAIPAAAITWDRNLEWKNDETLFIADVQKHPNSALCNGNAGARFMDRGLKYIGDSTMQDSVNFYADTAIFYLQRAVKIHPRYANGWLNLGLCYYNKKDYDSASIAWERVYGIFPSNPILQSYAQMLIGVANTRAQQKDYAGAAEFFRYGLKAYPADSKIWADYAGASFMAQKFDQAEVAFDQAYQRATDQAVKNDLANGYRAAHYNDSARTLWLSDTMNPVYNMMVAKGILGSPHFYPQVRRHLNHVLEARPGDPEATRMLDSLTGLEQKLIVPPKTAIDSTKIR